MLRINSAKEKKELGEQKAIDRHTGCTTAAVVWWDSVYALNGETLFRPDDLVTIHSTHTFTNIE